MRIGRPVLVTELLASGDLSPRAVRRFVQHTVLRSLLALAEMVFALTATLVCIRSAHAISTKAERYVLIPEPPAVAVIDLDSYKVLDSIPLRSAPDHALTGPESQFLYVLSHIIAKKGDSEGDRSEVTVIDIAARKAIKTISIPTRVSKFDLVGDQRYLFIQGAGRSATKQLPDVHTSLILIDTRTNEEVVSFSPDNESESVLITKDASRIFAMRWPVVKNVKDPTSQVMEPGELTAFKPGSPKPFARVRIPERPEHMVLSADEKWLYVLDHGYHNHHDTPYMGGMSKPIGMSRFAKNDNKENHRDGLLRVYDITTLTEAATHKLGTSPWKLFVDATTNSVSILGYADDGLEGKLYEIRGAELIRTTTVGEFPQTVLRFEDLPGRVVVSYSDLRVFYDDSSEPSVILPLNSSRLKKDSDGVGRYLEGWPGEVLYLPQSKRMIVGLVDGVELPPSRRYSSSKPSPENGVAMVNFAERKVEQVIKVGRTGVKVGKALGNFALAMGIAMASGAASYSVGSPYYMSVFPVYSIQNAGSSRLVLSPDGSHLYALNPPTNDVTIITTATGGVVDKIAVGGGAYRAFSGPGGSFVCIHTSEDITFIDTRTNKVHLKYHLPEGKITLMTVDEAESKILALTSNSIVVFDGKQGTLLGIVEGLRQPRGLVAPVSP